MTFSSGFCLFQTSICSWIVPVVSLPATYVIGPRPENFSTCAPPSSVSLVLPPQALSNSAEVVAIAVSARLR